MKNGAIPILTYHSLDEGSSALSLSPELFRRQMQFLKDAGFAVIDLVELAKILGEGAALPDRAVVLTFDDGFESFYTSAFPVLCRLGFPATVFVVVDYVGRKNNWPGQPSWVETRPLMNWRQLSELSRHGIAIGSHTLTHPILSELDSEGLWREIYLSKARLEERLGGCVQAFSYPYGIYSPMMKRAVSGVYLCGCTAQLGYAGTWSDRYALERVDVYYLKSLWAFERLLSPLCRGYLGLRRTLRGIRSYWQSAALSNRGGDFEPGEEVPN